MDEALAKTPYSDEWWFKRLFAEFHKTEKRRNDRTMSRTEWADYLWSWFEGNPPVPTHMEGWRSKASLDVLRMGRANLAKLAVESKMDRIELAGFRVSSDDTERQNRIDKIGRRLMKRYSTAFEDAMLYASVMIDGYVWASGLGGEDLPLVTAEKPQTCVTIEHPTDPARTIAALKLYRDDLTGEEVAHMVLPSAAALRASGVMSAPDFNDKNDEGNKVRVVVMRRSSARRVLSKSLNFKSWEVDEEASGPLPDSAQGRGVPVFHVRAPHGLGDFEPHIDLLERINNMIVDRLWITKLQVFRQRALRDVADPDKVGDAPDRMPETDPETGEKIDYSKVFEADPGSLWELPYGYDIWESTPADLTPILLSVRDDIKEYASSTRTPLYVFMPDAIQGSAEGAQVAREGQVFKADSWKNRQTRTFVLAGEMMFALAGEDITADDEFDLVWTPSERYSLSQRSQAAREAKEVGIPLQGIVEDFYQMSPETWQRYKRQRQRDTLQGLYVVPSTGRQREVEQQREVEPVARPADPVEELSQNLDRPRRQPTPPSPAGER